MKKVFLLFLALSSMTFVSAQSVLPINEKTNKICFQGIITTEGTIEEVYNRVYGKFLNGYYKNPMGVISQNNGEVIKGKHVWQMDCGDAVKNKCPYVNYHFTIEIREGRLRYTITDLTLKTPKSVFPIERWANKEDPQYEPIWDSYCEQLAAFGEEWGKQLEAKIQVEKPIEEEEW